LGIGELNSSVVMSCFQKLKGEISIKLELDVDVEITSCLDKLCVMLVENWYDSTCDNRITAIAVLIKVN